MQQLDEPLTTQRQPTDEGQWRSGLATLVAGLLAALGINSWIAEFRYVPSASMEPTVLTHDRVVVEKLSYRFHLPQRDDIVVFNPTPALVKQHIYAALIKRVIGLPGEQVQVKGGRCLLTINHCMRTLLPNQTIPGDHKLFRLTRT